MMARKTRAASPALQIKRRKVAQALLEGKNTKDSILAGGYSESTATKNPGEVLRGMQLEFAGVLDELLPKERMVSTLVEGLEATKVEHIYNAKAGAVEHFEGPDYYARTKCAELLAKLGGFIVRREESRVTHDVDWADIIAARRRVGWKEDPAALPPITDAVVEAQLVTDDGKAEDTEAKDSPSDKPPEI